MRGIRWPKRTGTLLCALLACVVGAAGSAAAQLAEAPATTLIRAGRLFDSERGVMLPDRDILVRGGVIEAVGEALVAPPGASVVDLRAYTVLPGLIDAHTHLLLEVEPFADITLGATVLAGDVVRALAGAARARAYIDAGFTTVRDLGNAGMFADVALRDAIAAGGLPGPRMYRAPVSVRRAGSSRMSPLRTRTWSTSSIGWCADRTTRGSPCGSTRRAVST